MGLASLTHFPRVCYPGPMPTGNRDTRFDRPEHLKGIPRSKLTPEQIAEINAHRSPSERINPTAVCGAKMTDKALKRRIERGYDPNLPPTCASPAGMGTDHPGVGYCKFHGGSTPSGKKAAARLYGSMIIDNQKQEIARFGGDRTSIAITPEDALLEEVRRSVAMVRWLEERIGAWNFEDLASRETEDPRTQPGHPEYDPRHRVPQPALGGLPALTAETFKGNATFTDEREWLVLYRQEREHAVKVSKMAIDAGIAKRMVSIAEDQGRMLALAIRHVLDALSLSPDQLSLVPQVVPRILREITQGTPMPSAIPTKVGA